MMQFTTEELIEMINLALDEVYKKDEYLIKYGANERNIVFHFARYLCNMIEQKSNFSEYNIDVECNRDIFNERMYKEIKYEGKCKRIIPDIVLHQRGSNSNNILAIECKKKKHNGVKNDFLKLTALTDNSLAYRYKLGLLIVFKDKREEVVIRKFINGQEIKK